MQCFAIGFYFASCILVGFNYFVSGESTACTDTDGHGDSSCVAPPETHGFAMIQKRREIYKVQNEDGDAQSENSIARFALASGNCTVTDSGRCVNSPNYQRNYGDRQECTINITGDWASTGINAEEFVTESRYDKLKVNGNLYSGTAGPQLLTPTGPIEWTADYSVVKKGWRLCAVTVTTTTPGPPTTPPPLGPCGLKGTDATPWPNSSSSDFNANIVNGQQATECEWKWQASLRSGTFSFCGGSLIHPKWVMSAAHCVVSTSPSALTIVLGDHDKNAVGSNETSRAVRRIIKHPSYSSSSMIYDFALIELTQRAPENDCIGTVCIPQPNDPEVGVVECFITGWGTLSSGGGTPQYLQEAKVSTVTNAVCNQKYPSQIKDSMICAQGRNAQGKVTDACQGDSGGPLVCQRNDGKFYLEGATSWGRGCAHADYPGVWARLSAVTDWTNQYVPAVPTGPQPPPPPLQPL